LSEARLIIHLPDQAEGLSQDEEYCLVQRAQGTQKVCFHDYRGIYNIPGLYEELFARRLKCVSPQVVVSQLIRSVHKEGHDPAGLKVLELGAGNGLAGAELVKRGVRTVVGADILEEAYRAMLRDRPHVYTDYFVENFCNLSEDTRLKLQTYRLNCLLCVAALGFGDVPPSAFITAFKLIAGDGWLAFNIKDEFLTNKDSSGFSRFIHGIIEEGIFEPLERVVYRHRLAVDGKALSYAAFAGRKRGDIPEHMEREWRV
jgi:SAM-dependent methyltransferase